MGKCTLHNCHFTTILVNPPIKLSSLEYVYILHKDLLLKSGVSVKQIIFLSLFELSKEYEWMCNLRKESISNLPPIDFNCLLFHYYSFTVNHICKGTPRLPSNNKPAKWLWTQKLASLPHFRLVKNAFLFSIQLVFPFLARLRGKWVFKNTWNTQPENHILNHKTCLNKFQRIEIIKHKFLSLRIINQ